MVRSKDIRNGSLYYNTRDKQTQRVLGKVNSSRVWTKHHQEPSNDVQTKFLRLARSNEVDAYIEASVPAL
jgi:hypothetical protein